MGQANSLVVCRAAACRDVVPPLRASGGRLYLFLEDGRTGRLLLPDAERLQVATPSAILVLEARRTVVLGQVVGLVYAPCAQAP